MTDTPLAAPRRQLLDLLKTGGPQSAGAIAKQLGVTAMAVRQHMYELEKDGLVASSNRSEGRGRPTRIWSLTEAAMRVFPDAHQGLAVELIRSVESLFGAEGLGKVASMHADRQRQTYADAVSGATSLKDRLIRLAELRTSEGYMAAVADDEDGYLFIENHCPVCSAAKACTNLCVNELDVFRTVLGPDVTIERSEHILAGARRCAYRVRQVS